MERQRTDWSRRCLRQEPKATVKEDEAPTAMFVHVAVQICVLKTRGAPSSWYEDPSLFGRAPFGRTGLLLGRVADALAPLNLDLGRPRVRRRSQLRI